MRCERDYVYVHTSVTCKLLDVTPETSSAMNWGSGARRPFRIRRVFGCTINSSPVSLTFVRDHREIVLHLMGSGVSVHPISVGLTLSDGRPWSVCNCRGAYVSLHAKQKQNSSRRLMHMQCHCVSLSGFFSFWSVYQCVRVCKCFCLTIRIHIWYPMVIIDCASYGREMSGFLTGKFDSGLGAPGSLNDKLISFRRKMKISRKLWIRFSIRIKTQ